MNCLAGTFRMLASAEVITIFRLKFLSLLLVDSDELWPATFSQRPDRSAAAQQSAGFVSVLWGMRIVHRGIGAPWVAHVEVENESNGSLLDSM